MANAPDRPAAGVDIVFFDLDDTLYSTTVFSERARRAAIAAMIAQGLEVTEDEGYAELSEVVTEFRSNYPHHFERLLDRLGSERFPGRNPAVLVAAGIVAYHSVKEGDGMVLLPDVADVLWALKAAEVRLGVVSAGLHIKQAEKLLRLRVVDYFDPSAIFFTDQMGISKPNPKLFTKACDLAGVAPERAIYIGDRPAHDIVPARHAGMHTVHYTGAAGKYASEHADVQPDYRLQDLRQLLPILRNAYAVNC